MTQKSCWKAPTRVIDYARNANPAAGRFPFEESISRDPGVTTRHNSANACHYHGRRRRHAFISAHEGPRQTRGAARWEISHRRYSHQQLSELGASLDLCAHAVQQYVATSTYSEIGRAHV